jgi:LmbE family N-acetylglucosaminyl deacetylase
MSRSTANARQVSEREALVVVAAHPDDEVLGCGGTIARMARQGSAVHVLLMADGESSRSSSRDRSVDPGRLMARKAAAERACAILGCASLKLLDLPDNRMDGLDLLDVVHQIEAVLKHHRPSSVLTHHAGDVNIDHRVVHDAVIAACRPQPDHSVKKLLFFEVPSSTEWRPPGSASVFAPNWFVDISTTLAQKLEALAAYDTEMRAFPHPRSHEAIEALAKWRGASIGVKAAEAFILGRAVV